MPRTSRPSPNESVSTIARPARSAAELRPAPSRRESAAPDDALRLQRLAGNRAVAQVTACATGASGHPSLQRWAVPAEDAAGNALLDRLDAQREDVKPLQALADSLRGAIPQDLRPGLEEFVGSTRARDVLADIGRAEFQAQARKTLDELRQAKDAIDTDLTKLDVDLHAFATAYHAVAAQVAAASVRHGDIAGALGQPEGAAQATLWWALRNDLASMNGPGLPGSIAAVGAADAATFTAADLAATRLLPDGAPRKTGLVQWVTDLFTRGRARLDTWGKFYPTNWDLGTGEFGAEWHIRSTAAPWLNGSWVFHAHCKGLHANGNYTGFAFSPIVGTNHIKLYRERQMVGVALDLPLAPGVLAQMAAPYQQQFLERVDRDSTFQAVLKKARGR